MKKSILTILIACILCGGCNEFLDTLPDNRTEIDSMDKIWRLLANAYPKRTYAAMIEARCDGMTSFGSTFQGSQQAEMFDFMRGGFYWMPHTPSETDDSHERFWEASYEAISYCNFALKALEEHQNELNPTQAKLARAEARICRAYNHFMLLTLFSNMFAKNAGSSSGVPYVVEPEEETFKKYDRETVAVTLEKIKKDLFEEIDNIGPAATYDKPKFRFTRDAAYAFAVRFCLFTEDYRGAVNYANKLFPMAATFTAPAGENFDGSPKIYVDSTDLAYQYAGNTLFDMGEFRAKGTDLYQPGLMFSDPQNASYLLMIEVETLAMRTFLGTLLTSYAYDLTTLTSIITTNATGGSWAVTPLQFTGDPTGFIVKYYEDMLLVNEAAGIGYVYNKVNLFRLEEVLLARAEAQAMLGNSQEAIDDLNLYTQKKIYNYSYGARRLDADKIHNYYRAKISDDETFVNNEFNRHRFTESGAADLLQRELIMAIMDFRRAEFIFEGMRYLDVLRWNIPISHTRLSDNMTRTLYPDDDNRILQLPASTLLSGLRSNPMKKIREPWPNIIYDE
ncbi:MAG: RagB/SusD family nutrient uptake outer membrane protein [Prevotellaceae bacterium]|jgi:hypothetical protein|nr:RagB/SusD family nutrient uptake outer membrane protein [Prevotellaceae bacterium]